MANAQRHYVVDKDLYKKMAHKAIDDECTTVDIMERIIDKLYEEKEDVEELESSNKWQKGFRLSEESWRKLDEISEQSHIAGGKIINFALKKYLK